MKGLHRYGLCGSSSYCYDFLTYAVWSPDAFYRLHQGCSVYQGNVPESRMVYDIYGIQQYLF